MQGKNQEQTQRANDFEKQVAQLLVDGLSEGNYKLYSDRDITIPENSKMSKVEEPMIKTRA